MMLMAERFPGYSAPPVVRAESVAPAREPGDVVRRAQAGDVRAFEQLYRDNLGRVYALCLRMTRDRTRAEELTQEAFVRAWEKLNSFRGDAAFSTWLHRLTVNLVLTDQRSRARRQDRVTLADESGLPDAPARNEAPRERMDLEAAIATLPEGARNVFVLYEIEGYRHEEIAKMMGIASGTTKAQLHRARRLLREALSR
jgi:RNA polymerase sigma-70 factor (ECF subfamily)